MVYFDDHLKVIFEGNAEVMGLLMTAPGADLALKNKSGKTAEQLARYSSNRL